MNNVSAYKCALLIYIRSYSTIVDIFTFFFLITSNLKAAKVLWERANRNQYELVYVYALHIFTSTNIFDINAIGWQIAWIGVCESVSHAIYNLFHSVHTFQPYYDVLSVCVDFFLFLLLRPFELAMCIFSKCRATNKLLFF